MNKQKEKFKNKNKTKGKREKNFKQTTNKIAVERKAAQYIVAWK